MSRCRLSACALAVAAFLAAAPAYAVPCGGASFEAWLESFRREAAANGIGPRGLAALGGVTIAGG